MLVSFNWLKQYIDLPDSVTADEVAHKLTMSTVEVEHVHHHGKDLDNIVVGKVLKADKHPNADKLKVCTVDVGKETLQIVCGGSNVREGMLAAVAKLGAKVKWHGEGEPVEMKEAEIRGVKSYGMICAASEIGLGAMFPLKEEKEILDLTEKLETRNWKLGDNIADVLGLNDAVLEIDNKSMTHRPDLWGHYGLAREVAAIYKKPLKDYKIEDYKIENKIKIKVKVEDTKLCPRYLAVAVSGVRVAASPLWLQQKIVAIGLRPINNIVDVTNYVMYDLGEPMHAFDAKKLTINNKQLTKVNIAIRRAQDGEIFKTLDGNEHKLDPSMLVIANEEKAIALAGIMGGEDSGITDYTTDIVFEAANFNAAAIRKAALKLGARTDSSARFEKVLDPNLCAPALAKAVELTLQLCPGAKVASKAADESNFHLSSGPIELPWEFLDKKIGQAIERKDVVNILERLGFIIKEKKNSLLVTVPTWRATKDISVPEDLVEEIARIYGYNNITAQLPAFPITPPAVNKLLRLERELSSLLAVGLGYDEVYNYSFVSERQIKHLGDDPALYLELDNPVSKERPFLRRHLVGNLLENVAANLDNFSAVKIFEIGKKFTAEASGPRAGENSDELLPGQNNYLVAAYADKKDKTPFWQARRAAQAVADYYQVEFDYRAPDAVLPWQHPARCAEAFCAGQAVGVIFEVHPTVAGRFGLEFPVGVAAFNLDNLVEAGILDKVVAYQSLPIYPEVERDLALMVKKSVTHGEITAALSKIDQLLKKVELFDVYEGATLGEDYKSMAYRLTYAHAERTLKSEEVDAAQDKIIKKLEKEFGAEVRR